MTFASTSSSTRKCSLQLNSPRWQYTDTKFAIDMPKAVFPPTPAPSMDIVGKDDAFQASLKDKASFTLPPPAIAPAPLHDARDDDEACLQTRTGSQYSLPPPPTRTRKIIQMTPKVDLRGETADSCVETSAAKIRHPAARSSPATRKATGKKQPSSTSQDGKRIARKTAHSVIERRRRSKMNEEFGVLKNMIPACSNQEMHKLAILQVSWKLVVRANLQSIDRRGRQALSIFAISSNASRISRLRTAPG